MSNLYYFASKSKGTSDDLTKACRNQRSTYGRDNIYDAYVVGARRKF